MRVWQLKEAMAKLSDAIATAKKNGPQIITQRGVKSAVVLPFGEWESAQQPKSQTLRGNTAVRATGTHAHSLTQGLEDEEAGKILKFLDTTSQ